MHCSLFNCCCNKRSRREHNLPSSVIFFFLGSTYCTIGGDGVVDVVMLIKEAAAKIADAAECRLDLSLDLAFFLKELARTCALVALI